MNFTLNHTSFNAIKFYFSRKRYRYIALWLLLCIFQFSVAKAEGTYPDPSKDPNFYIGFNSYNDSIVHLVWDHYQAAGIKEYVVERSIDGINFKPIIRFAPDSLKDLLFHEKDPGIRKIKNVLMTTETGSKRFIYNDIVKNAERILLLQYRVKIITKENTELETKTVSELNSELYFSEVHMGSSTLKPGETEILPMSCPSIQGQPSGYTPTGNQKQYYSNCCLVIEKEYAKCNSVTCSGSDCSCNCTSDPCCYHYCYEYLSCSCHPWSPCSKLFVWRVTSVSPVILNTTFQKKDVKCFGGSDGTASVNVTGGTGNYSYSWSPYGGSGASATGLKAGTYVVTINDNTANCITTLTIVISQPSLLAASIPSNTPASCNGGSDGSATGNASGGTPGYSYSWSNGQAGSTATALVAGSYTLTVTDANGCQKTAAVVITEPAKMKTTTSTTDVSCFSGNNGTATDNPLSGGTPPYSFIWSSSPAQTTQTATGLIAGSYSVTVTDKNGCKVIDNVVVSQPGISITETDVSCKSGSDGTATVIPDGPSPTYTYLWSNGGSSQTITGLIAGSYSVTVTDAYGCVISTSTIVNEPTKLIETLAKTDVSCYNGSNGTISMTPSGGTAGYTYHWMPSGKTTATVSGLTAGFYQVTVTDSKGCIAKDTITITQPPLLNASIVNSQNISCKGGNDGAATIAGSGGTPTYTYSWNTTPKQSTQIATTLTAGPQTGFVTDANGCIASASVTLTEPSALIANINTSTDVSCSGGNNGSAAVTASGSVAPYAYLWSTNPAATSTSVSSLKAGIYTVTVTDAHQCIITASIFINEPAPLLLSTAQTNVSCNGGSDGTLSVLPSGGTTAYQYAWNTLPVQKSQTATGLKIGTYSVTVIDAKGCKNNISGSITEPTPLAVSHTLVNELCFGGNNGNATENPSGGTAPYTYSWNSSPAQTSQTATALIAGNYVVTVKDKNLCVIIDNIIISEPTALLSSIPNKKNVSCFAGNDGNANALGSGGTASYSYSWSTVPIQNSQMASNLVMGSYAVTVSDLNGCTSTSNVVITEPNILAVNVSKITNVSCFGGNDGSAIITITGGSVPYTIIWNTSPVQTTKNITSLKAGIYTVIIKDMNNCMTSTSITITEPGIVLPLINTIKNVSCFGGNDGNITTNVSGGTAPYTYSWNTVPQQISSSANQLTAGTYTVTVMDKYLCSNTVTASVSEPPLLTSSVALDKNVSCFNGNNGEATATAAGGTMPYTYLWNSTPAQTDRSAKSLIAGSYQVTVTDFMKCTSVSSIQISEPTALTAVISSIKNVSCFSGNDGDATVLAGGGIPSYSYLWSTLPSQIYSKATGLVAGNYTVTVSDANNCNITANVNITEPQLLTAKISFKKDVSCYGGNDGVANASQSGGTAPYTYIWSNGASSSTITALVSGNYTVTVIDAKNCSDTIQLNIYEPPALLSSISSFANVKCKDGNDGSASVAATGGVPTYTYLWNTSPIQSNATASGLSAGTYKVIVTDQNGCSSFSTVNITEPDSIKIKALGAVTICIGQAANISSLASGGTPAYSYLWDNGSSNSSQTINPIVTSTYTVICTDANACLSAPSSVVVTLRGTLSVVASGNNTICQKQSGVISAVAKGGDGNYTYTWSNGSNGAGPIMVSPTTTTTYVVTVSDGCGTPPAQDIVTITVMPLPLVYFGGDTLKGCQPHTVIFTDSSNISAPSGLAGWHWDFGDKPSGSNNSDFQNPSHTYFGAGVYSVTLVVTTTDQCVDSLTRYTYIVSYPLPIADFTSKPNVANILKPDISFVELASGETSYLWNFGDGSTSKDPNPIHSYAQSGTYNACLTVTSQFKCVDEICHTVVIEPDFTFYIANAFSPNEDGVNDSFGGSGIGIKTYNLFIFDRWGNRIFTSEDMSKQWDGKANSGSNAAQEDVYVYIVKITDIFDVEHKYVGHVTLVR